MTKTTRSSEHSSSRFDIPRQASFWMMLLTSIFCLSIGLSACSDNSNHHNGNQQTQTNATSFRVTVTNTSKPGTLNTQRAMGTIPLSPGAYALFKGRNPSFIPGDDASTGIARIAEDGFPAAPFGTEVGMLGSNPDVLASGLFAQPAGKLPALTAGQSASFTVVASPGDKLTLVTMFVQSNDWFYALDSLDLFDGNGNPIKGDVSNQIKLYDAGTEADTPPGTGPDQKPVQAPTAANQGPAENVPINTAVQRHLGFGIPANNKVIAVKVEPLKPVAATTFDVTINDDSQPGTLNTNRAGGAVPLSPGIYAVYTGDNPGFTPGKPANAGTERIAEDGFPSAPLGSEAETLSVVKNVLDAGVFSQPKGKVAALEPGESTTFSVTASPDDKLTLETMFVQSNDWFYGLDGLALFDSNGKPVSGDITGKVKLYDAGTEADTAPGTGPDQKPVQPPLAVNQARRKTNRSNWPPNGIRVSISRSTAKCCTSRSNRDHSHTSSTFYFIL